MGLRKLLGRQRAAGVTFVIATGPSTAAEIELLEHAKPPSFALDHNFLLSSRVISAALLHK